MIKLKYRRKEHPSVLYFGVRNRNYPRNLRIRNFMERSGYHLTVIDAYSSGSPSRNMLVNLARLFRPIKRYDIIVLSEFSTKYALWTWFYSRLTGALHVVDGFVGLYESVVEDRGETSPASVKAKQLRVIDWLSIYTADIFLVDTDVRGNAIGSSARQRTRTLTLPVGAPSWAAHSPDQKREAGVINILYYGNYIPLHGAAYVVEAVDSMPKSANYLLTLVGDITQDIRLKQKIESSLNFDRFIVRGPVPENQLHEIIMQSDIVLGIFGTSPKAASVIANKVWQGLACGKTVITRNSPALAEIEKLVAGQLMTVAPASPSGIVMALESYTRSTVEDAKWASTRLEGYVDERFQQFDRTLREKIV